LDVLGLPGRDTGGGWLIVRTGPSELGVHPSSWQHACVTGSTDQHFDVSLMCDDLHKTMTELTGRGVEFSGEVRDESWGLAARLQLTGAGEMDAAPAGVRPARDVWVGASCMRARSLVACPGRLQKSPWPVVVM